MAKIKKGLTIDDFNGDQTAFDKYLGELETQEKGGATTEETKPEVEEHSGVIANISKEPIKFKSSGNQGRFLTLAGLSEQILVAEALFQNNKELLVKGMDVTVVVERRIADITGYIDSNKESKTFGKWATHTSSGLGFTRVELTAAQAGQFKAVQDKRREFDAKNGSKVTAIEAIMDKQASLLGDDSTALGHALSGAYTALQG